MTIRCFKLVTGEEVIADVDVNTDGSFKLEKPALVILQQNQDGSYGVGLAPFMTYAKNITLRDTSIVAEAELNTALENEYRRIFGSGIVMATAGSLPK